MKKQFLSQLVTGSYTGTELDARKIEKFASFLTRKELREYIKALKKSEQNRYVIITGAQDVSSYRSDIAKSFPNKELIFQTDKSLLIGMQIVDNDTIYEVSLKNTLNQLGAYINE